MNDTPKYDIHTILQKLPHRYPFLLVDRIIEVEPGKRLLARKNVTINEPFFNGHFPDKPVMPGVLILESMAQASIILEESIPEVNHTANYIHYFAGLDNVRFKHIVEPGDVLDIEVQLLKYKQDFFKVYAEASVAGQLACKAELMCMKRENSQ